jgi:hypothetical protein
VSTPRGRWGCAEDKVMSIPVLSPLLRCQCDDCSWEAGCGTCVWLSVAITEVEESECFGCLWLESRRAREENPSASSGGMEALQVPEGEASIVETQEFSGEESKEDRKRRLTRERVQRYRKARR